MLGLFVYPKITNNRKGFLIQKEAEDGKIWFGVDDAIKNYLEETGLNIKDVKWLVWSEKESTYLIIEAVTIKDWLYQFEKYIDWNTIKKG